MSSHSVEISIAGGIAEPEDYHPTPDVVLL